MSLKFTAITRTVFRFPSEFELPGFYYMLLMLVKKLDIIIIIVIIIIVIIINSL